MKVLYIVNSVVPGGATISFFNMLKELVKYGVEPIIAIPEHKEDAAEIYFRELASQCNATVYKIPIVLHMFKTLRNLSGILEFFGQCKRKLLLRYNEQKSIKSIIDIALKEKPVLIHSNSGVIRCGWLASKKLKIAHVWHLREYQDLDFKREILPSHAAFENMLNQSYVITITKDIFHYFHQERNPKAKIVYNGIFSINEKIENVHKEPYFLVCSRISPEKGHHNIIKAFGAFCKKNQNFRLKIAGEYSPEDKYVKSLSSIAESMGCSDFIDYVGFKKDVKALMSNARCLVVASPNEGFGRMTAEACFLETLVIGYNSSGTKEILDNTGGILYDGTIDDLVAKMEYVAEMKQDEYTLITKNAKMKARECYSIEANGRAIYDIYVNSLKN